MRDNRHEKMNVMGVQDVLGRQGVIEFYLPESER